MRSNLKLISKKINDETNLFIKNKHRTQIGNLLKSKYQWAINYEKKNFNLTEQEEGIFFSY